MEIELGCFWGAWEVEVLTARIKLELPFGLTLNLKMQLKRRGG